MSSFLQSYALKRQYVPIEADTSVKLTPSTAPAVATHKGITTEETVSYQRRELVKELTLLEGHLQQGCKINNKGCDCCEKHPIKIEGLAQETAGMVRDGLFSKLAGWAQSISPLTTEEASASGKYDDEYPKLAIQAREFRKIIMGGDVNEEAPPEA